MQKDVDNGEKMCYNNPVERKEEPMIKGFDSVLEPSAWRLEVWVNHGDVDTEPSGSDSVMTAELWVTVKDGGELIHVIDEVDDVESIVDSVSTHFLDADGYVLSFEDLWKMCKVCKERDIKILADCVVKDRKDGQYRVVLTDGITPISDGFLMSKEELERALVKC